MKHSTGKPNAAEQRRLEILSRLPCVACYPYDQPNRTEVHHLVDMGTRKLSGGHMATIPLDSWHHRGIPPRGMQAAEATLKHGPSLALNKRAFVERYGTERELLGRIDLLLSTVPEDLDVEQAVAYLMDRLKVPAW